MEVLDSSRVHPETYEWARKMAVDALEADDNADPTGALEEILNAPEKLKDLDLDAFADELERQVRKNIEPKFELKIDLPLKMASVLYIYFCSKIVFKINFKPKNCIKNFGIFLFVGLWKKERYSIRYSC